jgi:hypothetical protein
MRTHGAGAMIPLEYQGDPTPVVRLQVVYRPNQHDHELAASVAYLTKHGKGEDAGPGEHCTRDGQEPDIPTFLERLWKASWCFKVIINPPTETGTRLPLRDFAQSWMQQVEADLCFWLSASSAHQDSCHRLLSCLAVPRITQHLRLRQQGAL